MAGPNQRIHARRGGAEGARSRKRAARPDAQDHKLKPVAEQTFECRICLPSDDDSAIRFALQKAFPSMHWEEGDCVWDKVHVWGQGPDATIRVYRYESPGPFDLTI